MLDQLSNWTVDRGGSLVSASRETIANARRRSFQWSSAITASPVYGPPDLTASHRDSVHTGYTLRSLDTFVWFVPSAFIT